MMLLRATSRRLTHVMPAPSRRQGERASPASGQKCWPANNMEAGGADVLHMEVASRPRPPSYRAKWPKPPCHET